MPPPILCPRPELFRDTSRTPYDLRNRRVNSSDGIPTDRKHYAYKRAFVNLFPQSGKCGETLFLYEQNQRVSAVFGYSCAVTK